MTAYEHWAYMDPARILERKQEREARQRERSKQGKAERARAALEALFEGEDMGRRLEIAPHITAALHQWGEWANRPQFWANLSVTPFCKLVGIGAGREAPDIRLDPQSMAIHKAFMRMQNHAAQMILAGYYVAGVNWDDRQELYEKYGISRNRFYDVLKSVSIALFNAAKV